MDNVMAAAALLAVLINDIKKAFEDKTIELIEFVTVAMSLCKLLELFGVKVPREVKVMLRKDPEQFKEYLAQRIMEIQIKV